MTDVVASDDKALLKKTREAICQYMNAQGPHLYPSWKEFLIKECGLIVDAGNPYRPVYPPKEVG